MLTEADGDRAALASTRAIIPGLVPKDIFAVIS